MHHLYDATNLLTQSARCSESRQFLEKCFTLSLTKTPNNQFLSLVVLVILAIASTTVYTQAPHISRSLQAAGTHTVQELLWITR